MTDYYKSELLTHKEVSGFKETEIGLIPEDWDIKVFSDIVDIIGGGTPKTTLPEYWDGEIPWLSVVDFNNDFRTVYETEKKISELGLKNSSTKLLKKGDLIISARGTVGAIAQLGRDMAFNQSCYGLKAKNGFKNDFIYYLLKYSLNILKQTTHGSTFDTITRNTFDLLKVPIPTPEEQDVIANILSKIDDKIELNQQTNQTLEEIGQAIFRHWFVHFEFPEENGQPYKSSGGEMMDSELGEIPVGWEVGKLGDFSDITMGQSPKSEFYNEKGEGLPFHQGVTNFGERFPKDKMYCTVENKIAEKGDILFSVRAPVGRINIAYSKMVIGRGLSAIRHKNGLQSFLLYQLKNIFTEEDTIGSGTVFNAITRKDLDDLAVIVPDKSIDKQFHDSVSSVDEHIENLSLENDNLSKIRDYLLPKLMFSKIRVL